MTLYKFLMALLCANFEATVRINWVCYDEKLGFGQAHRTGGVQVLLNELPQSILRKKVLCSAPRQTYHMVGRTKIYDQLQMVIELDCIEK